jgi:tuberous sclerosis 2
VFSWMLKARANATYHIGYPDAVNNVVRFSNYLGIEGSLQTSSSQSQMTQSMMSVADLTTPASSFTAISIRRGCKCIVKCLETEKSWAVLQLVLKELPNILQNKALIQGNDVDLLARTLYNLYNAKNMTDNFVPKPSQSDFHNLVLPVIASLPTYHQFLEPPTQTKIVDALRKGLRTKICVQALTILILEMPDTLVRELPEVLLQMSKLSDTVNTAVAVLEFLSSGWL